MNKIIKKILVISATVATLCIAILLSMVLYNVIDRKIARSKPVDDQYLIEYYGQYVSPYVIYCDYYKGGFLYNAVTGEKTLTDINWICKSSDGDSLAFFSADKKRGYFNRFSGELAIPAQYDKAWVFSEDVACVYKDGVLTFINHNGNAAIDRNFPYTERIDSYCFHNGLCAVMGDNERIGLINKQGEWVVEPEYYYLYHEKSGFWKTEDLDGEEGLINAQGQEILAIGYYDISIDTKNKLISAMTPDYYDKIFDFDGKVVNACNYVGVVNLKYESKELDNDGCFKQAKANLMAYYTSGSNYGLIDLDGNLITEPIYNDITAISADRYLCEGPLGSVVLNDKGEIFCKR